MNVIRFTVVDRDGTISFVYDGGALGTLLEACVGGSASVMALLNATARRGPRLREYVTCGLAVFDEHNVSGAYHSIHEAIEYFPSDELPVFRVVDDVTREASLRPTRTGVIVFNLLERRIVQMHNSHDESVDLSQRVRQLQRAGWRIVP
ncbi:MAG TPA: hypothetical protein VNL16_01795 [Chloroflexota bacterium]|nr:hypothetical protein [Chloroflexota bacterium]